MTLQALTIFHTALSFVAILAGIPAMAMLLGRRQPQFWTQLFIGTAVATTLTGFLFPFNGMTPAIGTGIITTVFLVFLLAAKYVFRLAGFWRQAYVVSMVVNVYFLFFVLIAQAFTKVPALHALAPTLAEPPFAIAQGINFLIFAVLGFKAVRKFRSVETA